MYSISFKWDINAQLFSGRTMFYDETKNLGSELFIVRAEFSDVTSFQSFVKIKKDNHGRS